jgi:hypothetical protein
MTKIDEARATQTGSTTSTTTTAAPAQATGPEQQTGANPHSSTEGVAAGWRARPNADRIPCPALLALYNNGLLRPAPNGDVKTEHLDAVLSDVGIAKAVRAILVRGADSTDQLPASFNLFNLRDSRLDHTGSTGIRDPKVRPEKLPELLQFGENGRMYAANFARAANHFNAQDPGLRGTALQTTEFTAILQVFGRDDAGGAKYLTNEDVTALWLRGEFPEGWKPEPRDSISAAKVVGSTLGMFFSRAWARLTGLFG